MVTQAYMGFYDCIDNELTIELLKSYCLQEPANQHFLKEQTGAHLAPGYYSRQCQSTPMLLGAILKRPRVKYLYREIW